MFVFLLRFKRRETLINKNVTSARGGAGAMGAGACGGDGGDKPFGCQALFCLDVALARLTWEL